MRGAVVRRYASPRAQARQYARSDNRAAQRARSKTHSGNGSSRVIEGQSAPGTAHLATKYSPGYNTVAAERIRNWFRCSMRLSSLQSPAQRRDHFVSTKAEEISRRGIDPE